MISYMYRDFTKIVLIVMRNLYPLIFVLTCSIIKAQNIATSISGTWIFESMTTITKAEREEVKIVYADQKNLESLSFNQSGSLYFNGVTGGVKNDGSGLWATKENNLTIIVDADTTNLTYEIVDSFLTLIITEKESDEYYGFSTILKYKKP
tara:strand:- start:859 stop:1311 length:453 start_codon:yes stop_codon:yes gene_type:complete